MIFAEPSCIFILHQEEGSNSLNDMLSLFLPRYKITQRYVIVILSRANF